MKPNNVSDITKKIILAEKSHGLFNIKYKNKYPIWPFYRMYFYFSYLKVSLNTGDRGISAKRINFQSVRKFFILCVNSKLIKGLTFQNKKYIILSSSRIVNGEEIYTKDLKKVIQGNFIEFSLSNKFDFQKGPVYLDLFKILFKIISGVIHLLTPTPNSVKSFFEELEAPSSFNKQYKRYKIEYVFWYHLFRLILKIQKPYKIFFVSGVYFTPLIAAAESLNIKIYELQHGVINNFHLAYQFPNISRDGFYSNGILLFSDYWKSKAQYPIGTELITIGNDYYSVENQTEKSPKSILIISSGLLAKNIIEFIKINVDFFSSYGYKLNYKLHPDEFFEWEKRYVELKELSESGLLKVITNKPPLPELLAKSEFVIGVSSTVLYEGLDNSCKVFVLDLPTSEYFDDLIKKGVIKKLNANSKLTVEDLRFNPNEQASFFDPTNFEALNKIVQ